MTRLKNAELYTLHGRWCVKPISVGLLSRKQAERKREAEKSTSSLLTRKKARPFLVLPSAKNVWWGHHASHPPPSRITHRQATLRFLGSLGEEPGDCPFPELSMAVALHSGSEHRFRHEKIWVQIPALPLPSHVL